LPHAGDGLVHAAVHREDIDQAGGLKNPAHGRLRSGQRQVTTDSTGPTTDPQQHRQTAVADALQAGQVNDDRWPEGRHGRDQVGGNSRSIGQAELAAQKDDSLPVGVPHAEVHVKHGRASSSRSEE